MVEGGAALNTPSTALTEAGVAGPLPESLSPWGWGRRQQVPQSIPALTGTTGPQGPLGLCGAGAPPEGSAPTSELLGRPPGDLVSPLCSHLLGQLGVQGLGRARATHGPPTILASSLSILALGSRGSCLPNVAEIAGGRATTVPLTQL